MHVLCLHLLLTKNFVCVMSIEIGTILKSKKINENLQTIMFSVFKYASYTNNIQSLCPEITKHYILHQRLAIKFHSRINKYMAYRIIIIHGGINITWMNKMRKQKKKLKQHRTLMTKKVERPMLIMMIINWWKRTFIEEIWEKKVNQAKKPCFNKWFVAVDRDQMFFFHRSMNKDTMMNVIIMIFFSEEFAFKINFKIILPTMNNNNGKKIDYILTHPHTYIHTKFHSMQKKTSEYGL